MVRDIIKDIIFLSQKSVPVETEDLFIVQDLRDTLSANRESCVGMAANMIGYRKNIIVVTVGSTDLILLNPVIVKKAIPYTTVEGCLSLEGQHKTTRFRKIVVRFQDEKMIYHTQEFYGWVAQIIQHEIDHLHGIII